MERSSHPLVRNVALLTSIGCYVAALALPALCQRTADDYSGVQPLQGYACFALGLMFAFLVYPLLLWSPNALIAILWFRVFQNLETSRRFAFLVVFATLASAIVCGTLMPYRLMVGAGLWIASALFAAGAAIGPDRNRKRHP